MPMKPLLALSICSEVFPLIKTGGLADVTGALPAALRPHGIALRTLVPGYPAVMARLAGAERVLEDPNVFGGAARLIAGTAAGLDVFVLDAPHLYARPGNPYVDTLGQDWPDNAQRFAALAQAGAVIAGGMVGGFVPDVVHAHDWQAGLAPAYIAFAEGRRPATVMTVHNLAFQGQVPSSLLASLRLPASAYTPDGLEYYGAIGMLKAGLRYADRITTVSPSYAAEICTPEGGMGMDGLLRARAHRLSGILNGIDTQVWDPARDALLPAPFSAGDLAGRGLSRAAVQAHFGLQPDGAALLFGVVSRLTHQKGMDVLLDSLDAVLGAGAQLAVLGAGDVALQEAFLLAATRYPGRVGVRLGYDEALAHRIQAGCDAILVPSRFEPCGLTQLCAMRYGAVPVVSRVGGLADSVIDANEAALAADVATGVQFWPVTPAGLRAAIARVASLWADRAAWGRMQARGMAFDVSWAAPGKRYAALFKEAVLF